MAYWAAAVLVFRIPGFARPWRIASLKILVFWITELKLSPHFFRKNWDYEVTMWLGKDILGHRIYWTPPPVSEVIWKRKIFTHHKSVLFEKVPSWRVKIYLSYITFFTFYFFEFNSENNFTSNIISPLAYLSSIHYYHLNDGSKAERKPVQM